MYLQFLVSHSTNMNSFNPLEAVSRYRDPQIQVGGYLKKITQRIMG